MTERAEPEDGGDLVEPGEDISFEPPPEPSETPDPESSPFEEPPGEWLGEAELEGDE